MDVVTQNPFSGSSEETGGNGGNCGMLIIINGIASGQAARLVPHTWTDLTKVNVVSVALGWMIQSLGAGRCCSFIFNVLSEH